MLAGAALVLLALLPLAIWLVVTVQPGKLWSTRTVPAEAARLAVLVLFVAWVNPWWGICAAVATIHWMRRGWTLVEGGLLWPTLAMGCWLGQQASDGVLSMALMLALAVGVLQSLAAVCQACGLPIFKAGTMIHGTLGHRTGLGIYLAALIPLGFLTDYGWALSLCYGVGLVLSMSLVAWVATVAGCLILAPSWAIWLLPMSGVGLLPRVAKWNIGYPKWRHLGDSWGARWGLWRVACRACRRWPHWLIGHGATSFTQDSRQWIGRHRLKEVYREAHNDYVEFLYEHGLVGGLAMLGFAWSLRPSFAWGDPVTASATVFGIAMLGQFPMRVAPLLGLAGLLLLVLLRRVA